MSRLTDSLESLGTKKAFHLTALLIVRWVYRVCCTASTSLVQKGCVFNLKYSVRMNTFCHTVCCIFVLT